MQINQLKYFVAAVDEGSINRAATILFTSQPFISKSIKQLEKELNVDLINRSAKGIELTDMGSQLYTYAKNIIKNLQIMENIANSSMSNQLNISFFPSNMLAKRLALYCAKNKESKLHIEAFSCGISQIIQHVASGFSNIGFIGFPKKNKKKYEYLMEHNNLQFHKINSYDICIYVGPNHPLYNSCSSITVEELGSLKFVQTQKDFPSLLLDSDDDILGYLAHISTNHIVHTNSEHVMLNILKYTDMCTVDLDFLLKDYNTSVFHAIKIKDYSSQIQLGFICRSEYNFSQYETDFLDYVVKMYNPNLKFPN